MPEASYLWHTLSSAMQEFPHGFDLPGVQLGCVPARQDDMNVCRAEFMRDPAKREILLRERKFHTIHLTQDVFYGLRIALARGKHILAGKWEEVTRIETFEWNTKRDGFNIIVNDAGYIETFPIVGRMSLESKP